MLAAAPSLGLSCLSLALPGRFPWQCYLCASVFTGHISHTRSANTSCFPGLQGGPAASLCLQAALPGLGFQVTTCASARSHPHTHSSRGSLHTALAITWLLCHNSDLHEPPLTPGDGEGRGAMIPVSMEAHAMDGWSPVTRQGPPELLPSQKCSGLPSPLHYVETIQDHIGSWGGWSRDPGVSPPFKLRLGSGFTRQFPQTAGGHGTYLQPPPCLPFQPQECTLAREYRICRHFPQDK